MSSPEPSGTIWLDLPAAAIHAGVSIATLRRELAAGRLQGFRVGGRRAIRLRQADVDAWLSSVAVDPWRPS